MAPVCSCFRLCSETDARSFHLRLPPLLQTQSSPWYSYLKQVYHAGTLDLPVNLSMFSFFYLSLLPVEHRCDRGTHDNHANQRQTAPRVLLPVCSQAICDTWMRPESSVTAADIEQHARLWTLRSYQWQRSALAELKWVNTLRFLPVEPPATFYRSTSFVEVIRHASNRPPFSRDGWSTACATREQPRGLGEGVGYGCWFSPAVGTGVFLPVGRALFVADRSAVRDVLRGVERIPLLRRIQRSELTRMRMGVVSNVSHQAQSETHKDWDCLFAELTHARGYNTLFMLQGAWGSSEIVVAARGCMNQSEPLPTGCVPPDVGLRTGWAGVQPCTCIAEAGLSTIVNCAGGS